MRRLLAAAVGLLLVAGCGGSGQAKLSERLARPFAYDPSTPLELRDLGVLNPTYRVKVHDVSYLSPLGGRVPALLAVPPGKGPFAGMVFMHGSTGSRVDFLYTAVQVAARGAVALTLTSPFDRAPPGRRDLQRLWVQEVIDLRRGIDVLERRPDVDPKRIGFAGFSLGSEAGAILAAVHPRLAAVDLISGGGTLSFSSPYQPRRFVPYIRAPLLFQVGTRDEEIARARLLALIRPAPPSRTVRWAGHALNARATRDFLNWITERLSLSRR